MVDDPLKTSDDIQAGKFGKIKHFRLIKKSLLFALEKYYEKFAVIQVENHEIIMGASLGGAWTYDGQYKLHPDIVITFKERDEGYAKPKTIVVEAETSLNGLLKSEMRLTAYKLLRLNHPDKSQFMLYIALPTQLKGKAKKPEPFNDFWYFDIEMG